VSSVGLSFKTEVATMKMFVGERVEGRDVYVLPSEHTNWSGFLTTKLDGLERPALRPDRFIPGEIFTGTH
jgi:hypothetical protein